MEKPQYQIRELKYDLGPWRLRAYKGGRCRVAYARARGISAIVAMWLNGEIEIKPVSRTGKKDENKGYAWARCRRRTKYNIEAYLTYLIVFHIVPTCATKCSLTLIHLHLLTVRKYSVAGRTGNCAVEHWRLRVYRPTYLHAWSCS